MNKQKVNPAKPDVALLPGPGLKPNVVTFEQESDMFAALCSWFHEGQPVSSPLARAIARDILGALGITLDKTGQRKKAAHMKKMRAHMAKVQ